MPLRCLIVDDNASFRNEMRGLLAEQGIEVMPGAASGTDALRQVVEEQPDVVLIDIDLRGESGFDLARRVRDGAGSAAPHMILISTHDESDYADLIDASPALGFVAKTDLSASVIRRMLGSAGKSKGDWS
jgi:two-component system, NarL family, nitrate/nitrite response regulator NarL